MHCAPGSSGVLVLPGSADPPWGIVAELLCVPYTSFDQDLMVWPDERPIWLVQALGMESPTAMAAFASVLGPTSKIAEKGFEICAVDEQAQGLLSTVQQVAGQLDDARLLRREKSRLFTDFEKRMFDDTFRHCEDAIKHVASMAERSRADMDVSGGQIRMNTRLVFVLRNSPGTNVSLTQLGIASHSLNATIVQLNSRDSRPSSSLGYLPMQPPRQDEWKPPPTYGESQFLSSGRRRNMQRRATALGFGNVGLQPVHPVPPVPSDYSRPQSASSFYVPAVPSIPELMGDEFFTHRGHQSLPIIRIASAPQPSSDPIVIESEPIVLSPQISSTALSRSNISPSQSPPIPRRFNSVSSNSNSDPGITQPNHTTPPESAGVRTPPNSWAPQFQEPRPPPTKYSLSYPPQQPIIMPAPMHFTYPPYPDQDRPPANLPPAPNPAQRISPKRSWTPQELREYRSSTTAGAASPNNGYGLPSGDVRATADTGFSIRNTSERMPASSTFTPYSPDFRAPTQESQSQYVYAPSMARRGQGGGRHRSESWLDARSRQY